MLEALERIGDREAMRGIDRRGESTWSRSGVDLLSATGGWQTLLRERNVQPGDRVALDVPRGPELLPAHLAALAAGAAVVPINPALSAAERERVLAHAEPRAMIGPDDTPGAPSSPHYAERAADAPALLIFTSGTTGEPKGVPHSETSLEANLADLHGVWGLGESDRILHALPAHHVHGLVLALYGSARAGIPIVLLERFDADVCLGALAAERCTLFMGVPTMVHRMVRACAQSGRSGPLELPDMRLFVSGSAPLAPEDFREFEQRFGHAPIERYGLTETLIVSSNPLDGERRPGAVGFPLPQVEVRLAADGEIEVRGPAVMGGYWQRPDLAAEAFNDGFFRTGDLGHTDDDGYLVIHGRKKELIIVGGSNVLPGEVEGALASDPGVDELAAVGLPDPDRGEIVGLFVVARGDEPTSKVEARLRERAEHELAPYKRPRQIRFISELPRNPMGKLDRKALRNL
jgi:malonyl-CoA/methylmalonyl-CoA synthetase